MIRLETARVRTDVCGRMFFYLSRLPYVLVPYLQTEGGVVPAGILHPSKSVFVGTFDLQAEQPLASLAVSHNAVRTRSQPGPLIVDEQAAVQNLDGVTRGRRLLSLQEDVMLIKSDMIVRLCLMNN